MKQIRILVGAISGAILLYASAIANPFNDVEDRKTSAWIISAMGKLQEANVNDLNAMKNMLARRYGLDEIEGTFAKLQACRTVEKYKGNPLPLVAAEHYAFMRYEASKYGDTELRDLPKKYYDKKVALLREGKQDRLRTTDLPVAPPSLGAVAWANLGVEHGLADYRQREKKEPTKGTEAANLLRQMNLAANSEFFGWIGRTFGNTYTRTQNENCIVAEPSMK